MKRFILIICIGLILTLFSCKNVIDEDGLTQKHFLEDLDYILYTLENNFGLFDVAYWARDVDIYGIVNNVREDILNNPRMDIDEFYESLFIHFNQLWPIGHFEIISPSRHYHLTNHLSAFEQIRFSREVLARLTYPHVLGFYEERHSNEDIQFSIESSTILTVGEIEFMQSSLVLFGEQELAERLGQTFLDREYEEVLELLIQAYDIFDNVPNVITEIIEEGRIASLTINNFMIDDWDMQMINGQIREFLQETHDYEHLIIDLRANYGGSTRFFLNHVMSPLLNESLTLYSYAFFIADGDYSERYTSSNHRLWWNSFEMMPNYYELRCVLEILNNDTLAQFNLGDEQRLGYGFPLQTYIEPRCQLTFGSQPIFDGEIWLLTGPLMTSASQVAAWASKESGFATLVGEVTGGAFGGPRVFVALPNSGILFQMDVFYITDQHGRPLEAGTVPHHFNCDGMDALETVLSLIEEGVHQ